LTQSAAAAHAAIRFGLGAKPNTIQQSGNLIANDAMGWVLAQINTPADTTQLFQGLITRTEAAAQIEAFRMAKKARKQSGFSKQDHADNNGKDALRQIVLAEIRARVLAGIQTELPLQERLLRFWSNHFTTSIKRLACAHFVGLLEREVIRPHLFSSFETMLRAVTEHPAMLIYLDNTGSIGPDSMQGERRGKGLNENLAREIIELHTLGVDGDYSQADVTSFARVLTGWTIMPPKLSASQAGSFFFNERGHEPGAQTILGRHYNPSGKNQGDTVLHDLAFHPATAKHLATKLARHFIADEPPADVVERLASVYLQSNGNLGALTKALVEEPAAWQPFTKIRSTEDYLLAIWRGLAITTPDDHMIKSSYDYLGQMPYSADSPAGWGDRASDWAGPDAIMKRITWVDNLTHKMPSSDTTDLIGFGQMILGGLFPSTTAAAMTRAATRPQALALLLASPEMMRR
jgi:uncharacterized protein (DUF1800 family)